MTPKSIENTTKLWFNDLWSNGNLNIADDIIDENYAPEWIQIDKKGAEQVKHEVNYFRSVFPDLKYEIVDKIFTESKSWIRYRAKATHKGNAWGFEPTNKEVSYEGVTILTFNTRGKIIDRWGSFCFYDILTGLDLVPPFWELHETFQK
jgi:predicted ester cyclase